MEKGTNAWTGLGSWRSVYLPAEYEQWEFEINRNKFEVVDNKARGKKRPISDISPDENDLVGTDELGETKKVCFDESVEPIPMYSEEPDKQSDSNLPFATTSFANKNEMGMEAMDDMMVEDVILPEENDFSEPDSVNDELNPEVIADRNKSFLVAINGFRWELGVTIHSWV